MTDPKGSGSGPSAGDLFGPTPAGEDKGPDAPGAPDFEPVARRSRAGRWLFASGIIACALVAAVVLVAPSFKGAFAPKKPAASSAKVPAKAKAAPAPTEPAQAAAATPSAPPVVEVVLNCSYTQDSRVTCSGGSLAEPIEEGVSWLPPEQQKPAPAPAKAALAIRGPNGQTYWSADVITINEGVSGDLGSVRFVLANASP